MNDVLPADADDHELRISAGSSNSLVVYCLCGTWGRFLAGTMSLVVKDAIKAFQQHVDA